MLISLYLLTIIYTNTMGLIIISKCKPFINKEIESRGYIKKSLSDNELLSKVIKDSLLFFIPGYYLKKAIDLTSKDADIDKLIERKEKTGEFIKASNDEEYAVPKIDSIFKKELSLSLGKYEKPSIYKSISNEKSMYSDTRLPKGDEVDMDFWEEEENDLKPLLETTEEQDNVEIRKEPIQEYLSSVSDDELIEMISQLDRIRKLKKESEDFLNNKAA